MKRFVARDANQLDVRQALFVLRGLELIYYHMVSLPMQMGRTKAIFLDALPKLDDAKQQSLLVASLFDWLDGRFRGFAPAILSLAWIVASRARRLYRIVRSNGFVLISEGDDEDLIVLEDPDFSDLPVTLYRGSQLRFERDPDIVTMTLVVSTVRGERRFSFKLDYDMQSLLHLHFPHALSRYFESRSI